MGAYKGFIHTEFGGARSRDRNFTSRKSAESRRILNQYILETPTSTNIDKKWFVIFEHTNNNLSFGYVHLPQLECYFSFCFFHTFFLFL